MDSSVVDGRMMIVASSTYQSPCVLLRERLAGGTFIGRHYYVIVDSVLDNGIPSGNSFGEWEATPSAIPRKD